MSAHGIPMYWYIVVHIVCTNIRDIGYRRPRALTLLNALLVQSFLVWICLVDSV